MRKRKTIKQEDAQELLEKTAELIVYMRTVGWEKQLEGVVRYRHMEETAPDDEVDLHKYFTDIRDTILHIREYQKR